MGIAFTKYVDITSSVGGTPAVAARELIGRIFTASNQVPAQTLIEFTSYDDVVAFFGSDHEISKRAQFYFSWVSKSNTRARKLGVARWNTAAIGPYILGARGTYLLAQFTPITHGHFTITLNGASHDVGPVDLHTAASLADVAAAIETAVQAAIVALLGLQVSPATFTYDATHGRFKLDTNDNTMTTTTISAADPGGNSQGLGPALGLVSGATNSAGAPAQSVTDTLNQSVTASNNFGSFCFADDTNLSLQNVIDAATWNATFNVDFQFSVSVTAANAAAWSAAVITKAGTEFSLTGPTGEWHEMEPMVLLASTDYSRRNATKNYMYQMFPQLTPTVSDTTLSNTYDNLRVNYLGVSQEAGKLIAFYQRGVMMGSATAPVDMNVYGNEQWLKDALATSIMNLLLAVERVPANEAGKATLHTTLMSVIDSDIPGGVGAVQNGVISAGKDLTALQITVIGEDSGDPDAWRQVETIGYWLNIEFEQNTTSDNRIEFTAVYTLIYSKDDAVRKVEGSHVLI